MDFDDYETLPTNNYSAHLTAGAIAGLMEHCVMYPLDSVKTRMQSLSPNVNYSGVTETLRGVIRQEGVTGLVRGMNAVMAAAGPAHALYFTCYERLKQELQTRTARPFYIVAGLSGGIATVVHDAVMTPTEVVKQRLQMHNSPYKSVKECVKKMYRTEGVRAFYRSYTTQLTMNIPFQCIHFMTYECCQSFLNKEKLYKPGVHMLSGAIAGAVAAGVTTPLDVVKTLLNTQQHRVRGMVSAFKTVYRVSGPTGYFKGIQARIIYQMPSTAICWSVYELFKYLLSRQVICVSELNDKPLTPVVSKPDSDNSWSDVSVLKSVVGKVDGNAIELSDGPSLSSGGADLTRSHIGRTNPDKSKWSHAVLTGTQVLGTLNVSASVHGDDGK